MFSHDEYKIDDIRLTAEEQVRSEEDVKRSACIWPHLLKNRANRRTDRHPHRPQIRTGRRSRQKEAADIKGKLADIWEIGSEKITVYMEGGEKTAMNKTDYGPYSKTADDRTGERRRKPKLTKYHYFLFVFVLGVSFMLVSQLFSSPEKTGKDQTAQTVMSGRTEDKSGQKAHPF